MKRIAAYLREEKSSVFLVLFSLIYSTIGAIHEHRHIGTSLALLGITSFLGIIGCLVNMIVGDIRQKLRNRVSEQSYITNPPGHTMLIVARFLCASKDIALTFEPLIADMRDDYFDALNKKETRRAQWLRVYYFGRFCLVLGVPSLAEKVDRFFK